MFEEDSVSPLSRTNNQVAAGFRLDDLSPDSLVELYEEVRRRMPPLRVSDMNVEEELLLQFHTVRKLQTEIIGDGGVAPNQKAQVANTVGNCLERIAKQQEEIYDSESHKAIESLLIRMLKRVPKEEAEKFLNEYEELGRAQGLT